MIPDLLTVRRDVGAAYAAEEAAYNAMSTIIDAATDVMVSNYFDRLSVPYTVQCVSAEMIDFIQAAFIGVDTGKVQVEGWEADPTPPALVIDTWARAAIPMQAQRTINPQSIGAPSVLGSVGGLLPVASLSTRPAGKKAVSNSSGKQGGVAAAAASSSPASSKGPGAASTSRRSAPTGGVTAATPSVKPGTAPAVASPNGIAPAGSASPASSGPPPAAAVALSADEVEFNNLVKLEAKRKADAKQLADRLSRQMEELKGSRDFVVDGATGQVIPTRVPDTTAAAAGRKQELRYGVLAVDPNTAQSTTSGAQKGLNPVRVPAKKPGGVPAVGGSGGGPSTSNNTYNRRAQAADFYTEDPSAMQPMVDPFAPSGGVGVKEGVPASSTDAPGAPGALANAPMKRADFKVPKAKLSRTDFRNLAASDNMLGAAAMGGGAQGGDSPSPGEPMAPLVTQKQPPPHTKQLQPISSQSQQQLLTVGTGGTDANGTGGAGSSGQQPAKAPAPATLGPAFRLGKDSEGKHQANRGKALPLAMTASPRGGGADGGAPSPGASPRQQRSMLARAAAAQQVGDPTSVDDADGASPGVRSPRQRGAGGGGDAIVVGNRHFLHDEFDDDGLGPSTTKRLGVGYSVS